MTSEQEREYQAAIDRFQALSRLRSRAILDDPEDGSAPVREPRRPIRPLLTGGAALEEPIMEMVE